MLLATLLLAAAAPASAAIITVDSGTDDGVGCTLREAVASAESDAPIGGCAAGDDVDDEIRFSVGTVTLAIGSIQILEAVAITGPVTINAAPESRIFVIDSTEDIAFNDVTFVGGRGDGGALYISGSGLIRITGGAFNQNAAPTDGGAILLFSLGRMEIDGTSFTGNQARGNGTTRGGGAIHNAGGAITIRNATFTDNRALGGAGSGGAIFTRAAGTLDIESSTFTSNRSQRAGGAIEVLEGVVTVTASSFTGNTTGTNPGNGGAIHGGGSGLGGPVSITLTDVVATSNRASSGGAFWAGSLATLALVGVTVDGNIADGAASTQGGGGIYLDRGTLTVSDGVGGTSLSGNRATGASGSGGGLFVNGGTVTIDGGAFSQNRAQRAGGAIEITVPASTPPASVSLTSTVIDANTTGRAPGNGGGIHTTSGSITLTLDDVLFTGNDAFSEGGGLWINVSTTATVTASTFTGNVARGTEADNGGGGLFVNGGTASVTTSTFEGNTVLGSEGAGGGILAVRGHTTVSQSLLVGNTAGNGGGVASVGGATVTVENSTLVQNTARFGGAGFSAGGFLSFDSATIASNSASIGGGGLYNQNPPNLGVPFVTLANTIVANNSAANGPNLQGRHASGGWNVIGTTPSTLTFPATGTDQTGTDPLLGPLQDNGGPTLTAALQSGSPAIDTGNTDLAVDQRGVARTEPDDVGAVEFGDAEPEADILISEFEPNPDGTDPTTVSFEISGTPGASFSGTILSIENDGINGTLDRRSDISGSFDANGLLVVTIDDLENPTFTVVLATGTPATTTVGTDLDANDDGTIDDLSALGTVLDAVGVSDATGDDGVLYASGLGGTDILFNGVNEPSLAFRDASTGAFYQVLGAQVFDASGTELDPADFDADPTVTTFGAINPSYTPPSTITVPSASLSTLALDALAVVPNPFGSRASATFAVTEAQAVTVTLYDVMGRQVQQVFQGAAQAETPVTVSVDGSQLASGVYVLVLQGETVRATRQVTVAR